MGTQFLIDSNAVIDYLSGKLPPNGKAFMDTVVNGVPKVSVITKIEVLGYNAPSAAYQLLSDFMEDSDILELAELVVNQTTDFKPATHTPRCTKTLLPAPQSAGS